MRILLKINNYICNLKRAPMLMMMDNEFVNENKEHEYATNSLEL